MDDQGMVSMFQALMASGLAGFLGCPAVIYEYALVEFFENASVREGVIISTVAGQLVEISEEWFAESFDLPVDGLGDLSDIPKDVIFYARSIVSLSGEPVNLSGTKNQMKIEFLLLCDILVKAISVKAGSFNALTFEKFSLITAVVCRVRMNWGSVLFNTLKKMVSPGSKQAKGFAIQISLLLENIPNLELGKYSEFPASKILTNKTVHLFVSLNDRDAAEEATGATKPRAASKKRPAADAVLVEKDPMKGNPAHEHYFLICADIDMLVDLRAKVIDEVAQFFNSFSLKKLATINIEEMYKKEEQVLPWGETESPQLAIQRKLYSLLKYREVLVQKFLESWRSNFVPGQGSSAVDLKVIELLSDLHLFILEELAKEARTHGLFWKKPCCSKIFEGSPGDRGAVIARTNTNTRSSCWIRTMMRVDGAWLLEPCADKWVKIPQLVISCEVHRQRQYDDTLPPVNFYYKTLTKRWADICLEVVDFCASRILLPVGSLQFCGSVSVTEPVYRVAPRQSSAFAFRVSQFCSVFVDFSLFSWLPSVDITDLLSSIALDRTTFRVVQIAQERSILRNDRPAYNRTSFPASSTDFSEDIDDLKTYLAQSIADSQNDILSKLNIVAGRLREDLQHHENTVHAQVNNSCQDTRVHINGLIVNLGEYRKGVQTFGALVKTDNFDIQRKIDAQQAKLDDLDTQIAAMRNDQLEFQTRIAADIISLSTQISDIADFIRSGDAKKGEVGSSSSRRPPIRVERRPLPAPQPSPDVQGSGATQLTGGGSAERTPTFPPTVGTFAERVAMAQRHIIESGQVISLEEDAERVIEADRRESDRLEREEPEKGEKEDSAGVVRIREEEDSSIEIEIIVQFLCTISMINEGRVREENQQLHLDIPFEDAKRQRLDKLERQRWGIARIQSMEFCFQQMLSLNRSITINDDEGSADYQSSFRRKLNQFKYDRIL
ncbi:hypothetical protein F511_23026 [Dorcoceras hygrometricum]|uniref:Dystroglycan-like n=1 Tax=Dorcoceras hygrometricum TaxID=472368 RepID=A0A2Z7ABX7_9LAMI|nr:hypothetical protein F511_23026 [Dorcoceras hygrometricum]